MKKFLFFLVTAFVLNISTKAQYVTIPDDNLRFWLKHDYPSCFNASDMMDTTCTAIVNETYLFLSVDPLIMNWNGYQYFKHLQKATFYGSLSAPDGATLPNLPGTLKELEVKSMPTLLSYPPLPPSLEHLMCTYHAEGLIASLPASIRYIDFSEGGPGFLGPLPAALDTFIVYLGGYSTLPDLPSSLKYLDCNTNYLTSLPALPASLRYLSCTSNQIVSLPVLPDSLRVLEASSNVINYVPNFPSSLKRANIAGNELTSLPPLPASLISLDCSFNYSLHCLPIVPAGTNGLVFIVNENTTCISNHPSPSYTLQIPYETSTFPFISHLQFRYFPCLQRNK